MSSVLKHKADLIYKYNTDTDEEKRKKMEEGTIFHKYCEDYLSGKSVKIPGPHVDMFEAINKGRIG